MEWRSDDDLSLIRKQVVLAKVKTASREGSFARIICRGSRGVFTWDRTPSLLRTHFVQFRNKQRRLFRMSIGEFESYVIDLALRGQNKENPLLADTAIEIVQTLGAVIDHVAIINEKDGLFEALCLIKSSEGTATEIKLRPSDALALALRCRCPVYVSDEIIKKHRFEFQPL